MFRAHQMTNMSGVVHGFSTRVGANGSAIDLSVGAGPEMWSRLALDAGLEGAPVAFASQVHGATVLRAESGGMVGEADALWTDVPGLMLAMRTADCVPIVMACDGAVAAIHAGWRGLAAGVIDATVRVLSSRGPHHAVVGPSICCDCYEVGEEVVRGLAQWTPESTFVDRSRSKPHVDAAAAAVAQLRAAGVERVERVEACTRCDERLWSHRQDGSAAGRQAGVIALSC